MLFLFLICHDDTFDPPPTIGPETEAWVRGVEASRRAGGRARPAEEATVVRVRDGRDVTAPGPRTAEREQVAGFDLLEFADLDEALTAARAHPMAVHGTVEVRPMWEE